MNKGLADRLRVWIELSFVAKKGRALYHLFPVKTTPYEGASDGLPRESSYLD
jgi:hypothetical protein